MWFFITPWGHIPAQRDPFYYDWNLELSIYDYMEYIE
jgi:hypothetical protein